MTRGVARQVAVCGPADPNCPPELAIAARRLGELLADAGCVVLCGGGSGVMAAVAQGATSHGGVAVGIWRGDSREGTAPDLSVTLLTNMGQARNAVLVGSADAVVAIGGSWGTLSEVALAMRRGSVPVISLGGWRITDFDGKPIDGIAYVQTPEAAARLAIGTPPETVPGGGEARARRGPRAGSTE